MLWPHAVCPERFKYGHSRRKSGSNGNLPKQCSVFHVFSHTKKKKPNWCVLYNRVWFQSAAGRVPHAVRHLRGQLDQAVSRIRTLEAELRSGRSSREAEVNGSEDWHPVSENGGRAVSQKSLRGKLHRAYVDAPTCFHTLASWQLLKWSCWVKCQRLSFSRLNSLCAQSWSSCWSANFLLFFLQGRNTEDTMCQQSRLKAVYHWLEDTALFTIYTQLSQRLAAVASNCMSLNLIDGSGSGSSFRPPRLGGDLFACNCVFYFIF